MNLVLLFLVTLICLVYVVFGVGETYGYTPPYPSIYGNYGYGYPPPPPPPLPPVHAGYGYSAYQQTTEHRTGIGGYMMAIFGFFFFMFMMLMMFGVFFKGDKGYGGTAYVAAQTAQTRPVIVVSGQGG